jgi:hypothetical protein
MAKKNLTESKKSALGRRIYGHIGRTLQNPETFKIDPHRMGWISQAAMGKGIRRKKVTIFILHIGHRNSSAQRPKPRTSK